MSYVINDRSRFSDATRQRVLEAAARLGYRPSAAGRDLQRGRSDVVMGLLPDVPIGHVLGEFLRMLSTEFAERGLTFALHPAPSPSEDFGHVWRAIDPVAVVTLDALRLGEAVMEEIDVPIVEVVYEDEQSAVDQVILPNRKFGMAQVAALLERHHEQIGYAYPSDRRLAIFAEPRLAGVRAALSDAGLPEPALQEVSPQLASAQRAIEAWTQASAPVTGVCAYNDEMAMALLRAAELSGVQVPDRLAVVGVDDIQLAELTRPALTTVATDLSRYATRVAAVAADRIAGGTAAFPPLLDRIEIIRRESV